MGINIEELKKQYMYCHISGNLTVIGRSPRLGILKGLNQEGYIKTKFKRKYLKAHRICWAIYYGEWPSGDIDHINGIRIDNRIKNLRIVTSRENSSNQKRHRQGKLLGAYKEGNKWRSSIMVNNKKLHLGYFLTAEEANAAYLKAFKAVS